MVETAVIPTDAPPSAMPPGQAIPEDPPSAAEMDPAVNIQPAAEKAPEGTPEKFLNADGSLNTAAVLQSYQALEAKLGETPPPPADGDEPPPPAEDAGDADLNIQPLSYGKAIDAALEGAGLTPNSVHQEYVENGALSDETISKLEQQGYSREVVDQFVRGFEASAAANAATEVVAEAKAKALMETAGGADAYRAMTEWAGRSLKPAQIEAFNAAMDSGDDSTMELAIQGLRSQYVAAEGSHGRLNFGGSGGAADVFNSARELEDALVEAHKSGDPAKIHAVERKAIRSNVYG